MVCEGGKRKRWEGSVWGATVKGRLSADKEKRDNSGSLSHAPQALAVEVGAGTVGAVGTVARMSAIAKPALGP